MLRKLIVSCLFFGISLAWAGNDWSPMSKQEALTALGSFDVQEKRKALGRLAEIGDQNDVPQMLKLLWDDNEFVRGMAEQAIWGLWLRVDDPTARPIFQTGIQMTTFGEYSDAIKNFNRVVLAMPDFAEVWNKLGDVYSHLGDYEMALNNYLQALEFNPYHFGAMESCGSIWLERQDLKKAAFWLRKALDLNPNLISAGIALRRIEEELGQDDI